MKENEPWVRKLGIFALLAVIAQGLLGGLTVKLMLPLAVSTAHATLAQLFFCTTVSLAVFTSRSWMEAKPIREEKGSLPLRYLCTAAAGDDFSATHYRSNAASFGNMGRASADWISTGAYLWSARVTLTLGRRDYHHVATL